MQVTQRILFTLLVGVLAITATGCSLQNKNKPEDVLKSMRQAMSGITSYEYTMDIVAEGAGLALPAIPNAEPLSDDASGSRVEFTVSGSTIISDTGSAPSQNVLTMNSGDGAMLEIETRTIDDTQYILLKNLAGVDMPLPAEALGMWYSMPAVGQPAPDTNNMDEIRSYIESTPLFEIKQDYGIDNGAHHFQIGVKKDSFKKLVELTVAQSGTAPSNEMALGQLALLDQVAGQTMDIWIDAKTSMVQKVRFNQIELTDEMGTTNTLSGTIMLSNYNNVAPIVAPAESRSFMELMSQMMQGTLGTQPTGTPPVNDTPGLGPDALEQLRQQGVSEEDIAEIEKLMQ